MKFIDKLERKFGRFGIPNLTIYMIVCYVIGYALMIVNPGILNWLSLEPAYILRGQVWRLVTWVLYPPSTSGVLWFAIAVLFFYYPIGTSLERTIGTFKYTLYILSGVIFTILGAFILYFLLGGNVLVHFDCSYRSSKGAVSEKPGFLSKHLQLISFNITKFIKNIS